MRRVERGMTLLEVLVSLGIMAMISLLIYGAFDSMSRGRRGEALRADRARQGRDAVERIAHELQTAFLSLHQSPVAVMLSRKTAFVATNGPTFDRVDFTAFAHRRIERDSRESDQAEIGYFVVPDPDKQDKMDLVRREQAPIDIDPLHGGVVNVLAEDVESFELKYFDPQVGQWIETWDSTQAAQQLNRLPIEIRISLTLKAVKNTPEFKYTTKILVPVTQALTFGFPQ